jgi:hypothetical protein
MVPAHFKSTLPLPGEPRGAFRLSDWRITRRGTRRALVGLCGRAA